MIGRSATVTLTLVVFLGLIVPRAALATADWSARVDDKNALPLLDKGGRRAMSADFVFWGEKWRWTDLSTNVAIAGPFSYELSGSNDALRFTLNARVARSQPSQLRWNFALDAAQQSKGVIGGGIAFEFDLDAFGSEMGEPELLPDNEGWAWGHKGGPRFEMRFEPPLASVYFEPGGKNEIRAFFYKGSVPRGLVRHQATLIASPAVAIVPTEAERFGVGSTTVWPIDRLDWRESPVDLSFLNALEKPAGKRGFLHARDDRLVFEDGTPARFWGTNLSAYALFETSKEAVRAQAKRLAALGFNLVRLHHHDSAWVEDNIFGSADKTETRKLDARALDAIDWWVKCLKDEGIYVWLDLHVGRAVAANDGIDGFEEIRKRGERAEIKGYNYVNTSIKGAMRRFNEAYLTHRNPYTGLRYVEEPAVIAVLITNENDLTSHFGNALLPDKGVPKHNRLYMAEAETFARKYDLSEDQVWRSWEHGPSKLFLNDLEYRFNQEMIGHLRDLGLKSLIVTTSTWGNPLSSLPALTSGDLVDVHAYSGSGFLERNPAFAANIAHWIAAGQVAGKPLTVSEWNAEPFPSLDRHLLPVYIAGVAGLQGWDALMQYAYSQAPLQDEGRPSNWSAFNDPALIAVLPAAALLYRRGDVRESDQAYLLDLRWQEFFGRPVSPDNSVALRTAAERRKLVIRMPETPALPWLQSQAPSGDAAVIRDPDANMLPDDSSGASSETGELYRDWGKGIFTVDTPRTQAAMGWIGGQEIRLKDVVVASATRNATVVTQSVDGKPISESEEILLSLAARSLPSAGNRLPFRSEPVEGSISVRAPPGLHLLRVGPNRDQSPAAFRYRNGRYEIPLEGASATHWLLLKRAS